MSPAIMLRACGGTAGGRAGLVAGFGLLRADAVSDSQQPGADRGTRPEPSGLGHGAPVRLPGEVVGRSRVRQVRAQPPHVILGGTDKEIQLLPVTARGGPGRAVQVLHAAQKHDCPSAARRRSYARRTAAERGFATAKDPAGNDTARGWCRPMGLASLMLFTVTLPAVRNQRILAAWNTRQEENTRRAAKGLPPENPPPPAQDPHRGRVPPARPDSRSRPHRQHQPAHYDSASLPAHARKHPRQRKGRQRHPFKPVPPGQDHPLAQNVRPKRETRPARNVKTSPVRCQGLEPRTRGLRAGML